MITFHSVTRNTYESADDSVKTDDKLYFLTDTGEIYRGKKLLSNSVQFYSNTLPENPAINCFYIKNDNFEISVYDGFNWTVLFHPIQSDIDILNTTKPVSGFAVFDYTNRNFVKYSEISNLTDEEKTRARTNIGAGAPQINSDFDQNDETSVDFIKNRPFYSISDTIYIINSFIFTFLEGSAESDNSITIDEDLFINYFSQTGNDVNVIWNGEKFTSKTNYSNTIMTNYIGNGSLFYNGEEDTGEPFAFNNAHDGNTTIRALRSNTDNDESIEVKIFKTITTDKKIDNKYLPTMKGATSENPGISGIVPIPEAGDDEKFLKGDGTWSSDVLRASSILEDATSNHTQDIAKDNNGKLFSSNIFDYLVLKDEINGCNYFIKMNNGTLISVCELDSIQINSLPNKVEYKEGDVFDPDGLTLLGVYKDGNTEVITTGFVCSTEPLTMGTTSVEVMYTQFGKNYTISVNIIVKDVSTDDLIDFNYTTNEDGTYTITSWKETLNGEPSTEMIIPDSEFIVL